MTSSDCCIDCGAEVKVTGFMIVDAITDRCIFCSLTLAGKCRRNWIEYYMVASGLLEARRK